MYIEKRKLGTDRGLSSNAILYVIAHNAKLSEIEISLKPRKNARASEMFKALYRPATDTIHRLCQKTKQYVEHPSAYDWAFYERKCRVSVKEVVFYKGFNLAFHEHYGDCTPCEIFAKSLRIPWKFLAKSLRNPWEILGNSLGNPWKFLGSSLGTPWKFLGKSLEIPWEFLGNSLEIPWELLGNSLEIPWKFLAKSHPYFHAGVADQIYAMHRGFLEEIPSAAHVIPPPSADYLRVTNPDPAPPRVVFRLEITDEDIREGALAISYKVHSAVHAYTEAQDPAGCALEAGISKALECFVKHARPRHGPPGDE
jgi:hypothetical protein